MDYGENAGTIAAHVTLVVALALLVARFMRGATDRARLGRAEDAGLSAGVGLVALTLSMEAVYYIAARALKATGGPDLWAAHPTPELLRLLLVAAVYLLGVPFLRAWGIKGRALLGRVAAEAGGLAVLWALLTWWLR